MRDGTGVSKLGMASRLIWTWRGGGLESPNFYDRMTGISFLFEDGMNCIGFKMQSLAALVQLGSWFYKN